MAYIPNVVEGDLTGSFPNLQLDSDVIVDSDVNISANIAQSKIANLVTDLAGKESAGTASSSMSAHIAASDPHVIYQLESERAQANGYASLDSGTRVPITQLPTGTTSTDIATGDRGLPVGGALDNILAKNSATNYDTKWMDSSLLQGPEGPMGPEGPPGQSAGKIFYYSVSDASDIATYKTMLPSPSPGAEQTLVTTCTGVQTDFLVASFATDPGVPGAVDYPAGTAYRRIYAKVNSGTARFHLMVYVRNLAGTETLIRDEYSHGDAVNAGGDGFTDQVVALQEWVATSANAGTLLSTDRIVNKIYAQRITGGGGTVNVTTYWEGTAHTSQIQTTISAGAQGPEGPAGPGVAAGGTTGQSLVKLSNTDYDTGWSTVSGGGGSSTLDGLTDVDVSSVAHNQGISFDSGESMWYPTDLINETEVENIVRQNPWKLASNVEFTVDTDLNDLVDSQICMVRDAVNGPPVYSTATWHIIVIAYAGSYVMQIASMNMGTTAPPQCWLRARDEGVWYSWTQIGGAPSGSAGGDLAGTYPNPTLKPANIDDADISGTANIAQSKILNLTSDLSGKAASAHTHAGVYDPAGTASSSMTSHTGAADPHTGYIAKSLVNAKGEIIVGTADNTVDRLALGTNGHVLTADSTQATGVKWAASAGGGLDETTANGLYVQLDGDVPMSGPLTVANIVTVNSSSAAEFGYQRSGVYYWSFGMDGSGNAPFYIERYNNSGASLGQPLSINRQTGVLTISETEIVDGGLKISAAAGVDYREVVFRTGVNQRFSMGVTADAESGSNAGSNFVFARYDDAGAWIDNPLTIQRNNGEVKVNGVKVPKITVSTTAPGSPATGDVWIDTN